jgi:hypothetical protein
MIPKQYRLIVNIKNGNESLNQTVIETLKQDNKYRNINLKSFSKIIVI